MNRILSKMRALHLAEPIITVGMGKSGRVTLDLLREAGYQAIGVDEQFSERRIKQCSFDDPKAFAEAATLIVSPGVDRRRQAFQASFARQINDIELFALLNDKPVLAVTGSNGKSTVVSLLADALSYIGKQVRLCGNIGRPVLDALFDAPDETDVYVVELSSYQLELCPSLHPQVGAVLNVSPDHLDRYDSFADYSAAKGNLVRQSEMCVLNGEDEACAAMAAEGQNVCFYGFAPSMANHVARGILSIRHKPIVKTQTFTLHGKHNEANILCALLMLQAFGIEPAEVLPAVKKFAGLAHRMRTVCEKDGIRWVNDSKATNIGATAAALSGVNSPVILIVGGVGKNQDFRLLAEVIKKAAVKAVLLIGRDNRSMTAALQAAQISYKDCGDMAGAVAYAGKIARAGDEVLLSPACASFDQFSGYHQRGQCFAAEVNALCR